MLMFGSMLGIISPKSSKEFWSKSSGPPELQAKGEGSTDYKG